MAYDAYMIIDANDPEKPDGIIWWDGKHTRASSDAILRSLKKMMIPYSSSDSEGGTTTTIGDGRTFFDKLPLAFKSGYTSLKKAQVDEDGKPV